MNQFRPSTTPWEQPSQGAKRRRPSLPVHFSDTGLNAFSKEKKTTTDENKTNKQNKTTENVVMMNVLSNDGHKKRCCAWRTQESISDVAGVTVGVT